MIDVSERLMLAHSLWQGVVLVSLAGAKAQCAVACSALVMFALAAWSVLQLKTQVPVFELAGSIVSPDSGAVSVIDVSGTQSAGAADGTI